MQHCVHWNSVSECSGLSSSCTLQVPRSIWVEITFAAAFRRIDHAALTRRDLLQLGVGPMLIF